MATPPKPEDVFSQALEQSNPAEQAAYLDQACAGDEKLRAQVEALLRWHTEAGSFLEMPPVDPDVTLQTSAVESPGTVIGRYKLLEKIGEGGMATVYMAEQKHPIRRRVALKLIKLGMDTKQVIARFEAERQALAMMDHPNIAKVFDAGTTETGRPYFVMELVKGLPITEFCDSNHLTPRERLDLFISICHAVQHAHQRGIIHRDIKPSNVLVTLHDSVPVVKVIDFGIAKAVNQQLTEKTVFTRFSQMIGTPEYMSPEQAEMSGLDIDTRTDVFSLGVLLYELLTGTTPFDSEYLLSKGYGEMQRIIREEEPIRPSTKISTLGESLTDVAKHRKTSPDLLCKLIRTDLDWIVMKTLEKDRNRRYESVSELAADIKRHLDNEPVLAGRPSTLYRFRKFVQRRRVLVTAVTAVALAVMVGFVTSTTMYVKAKRSALREAVARDDAEAVVKFFTNDLLASVYPERAKSPQVTVRYIIETASEQLEHRFQDKPHVEAEVREALGLTYEKLADYKAAATHMKRVWELRREQLGEEAPDTLAALSRLGRLYVQSGQYEAAEPILLQAIEAQTRALGKEHCDTLQSMCDLSSLYIYQGRFDEADVYAPEALEIGSRVLGEEHVVTLDAMKCCAFRHLMGFQSDRAEPFVRKGYEICGRVLSEEHESTLLFMNMMVLVYRDKGRHEQAFELASRAFGLCQKILGDEHLVTLIAMDNLAFSYTLQGRFSDAAPLSKKCVELSRQHLGTGHFFTAYFTAGLALLHEARGEYDDMETLFIKILEDCGHFSGKENIVTGNIWWRLNNRALSLGEEARRHYDSGDYDNAVNALTRQQELRQILYPNGFESPVSDLALLSMSLHQLGHDEEALATLERVHRVFERGEYLLDEHCLFEAESVIAEDESQARRAWSLIGRGELEEADDIIASLQASVQQDDVTDARAVRNLVKASSRAYCFRGIGSEGCGQYSKAIGSYEAALKRNPASARAHDQLARLYATCQREEVRDSVKAIEHARKACELTDWRNASFISTLAAAHAESGDCVSAVQQQKQAMSLLSTEDTEIFNSNYDTRLRLYESGRPYHRSLIAKWTFERLEGDIISDSSVNGMNGQLMGDACLVEDMGRPGKVLCLDGDADWVDCGDDGRFDITNSITIACWIKVREFDIEHQTIIGKGDNAWRIARDRERDALEFACSGAVVPGDSHGAIRGNKNVNDRRWHHVAGVYDGTRIALYIDGELDIESKASGRINTNSYRVLIGENDMARTDLGRVRAFDGLLDDVCIYDYVLTEAEIKALCNHEAFGSGE